MVRHIRAEVYFRDSLDEADIRRMVLLVQVGIQSILDQVEDLTAADVVTEVDALDTESIAVDHIVEDLGGFEDRDSEVYESEGEASTQT